MRITIDITDADRACPDCGEKAHAALDAILIKGLGTGLAKGGEVDAIGELEALVMGRVDKRLKRLAKSLRRKS